MRSRDRLAVGALSLVLALICGALLISIEAPGQAPADSSAPSPTASAGPSTTFREAEASHPSSITPLTARTQADRDLVSLLLRGLVKAGADGALEPDLARSWTTSTDGKSWTFELDPNARWEDGKPVTASDVAFTVNLAADPDYDGPLGATWQGITPKANSATEIQFTLQSTLGGFLRQATLPILPEHLLGETDVTALGDSDYAARPIGDGPFRLTELNDSHALLTRSDAAGGTGNVSKIEIRFFDDQASAAHAFQSWGVDAVSGLVPGLTSQASTRPGANVTYYHYGTMFSVALNQRSAHPEFANVKTRQGLLAGIHRSAILQSVLRGHGTLADVPLPSWSAAYDAKAFSPVLFEPATAAEDLAAAGWTRVGTTLMPAGKSDYAINLLTPDEATNPITFAMTNQVASDWKALGLKVNVQALAGNDYVQKLSTGDFDAAVVSYQLGLDPDVSPLLLSTQVAPVGSNLSGVSDKTLDGLLGAVRTTYDPAARQQAVSSLEGYISSNQLMLPLCFADYGFVLSGRIGGLRTNEVADPSGRYWDVLDWRLASDG